MPVSVRAAAVVRVIAVDNEEWARRASSFGSVAAAYAEHRPDYPEAAIRWALAPLPRDIAELEVLDLGAGTGKLTALLAALGATVTAVEPDESMLGELRRQLPGVRALHGPAEEIGLPDASVDAVLCGQSLHWFDMSRAVPEIARVLRPDGVLGALWNSDDDRVEWVSGLQAVAGSAAAPALSRRRAEATGFADGQFGAGLFTPVERAEFGNSMTLTADTLIELMRTHSQLLVMASGERERLLGRVRGYLASRPETAAGEFRLPLVTSVLRTVRR